ncbi:ankyrin repeat domain-containing protein [Streptomyces sp. TP-A0356]|uniref:ankyrin repeat domain-containing protein n=1 Tax=Streptomyces sp. TP-A0356 TaxID=1359208 RepID=UPI0006E37F1D|nr:ankyrin repeat domain-containing protein [Streptomyces sp. TP-A0356]
MNFFDGLIVPDPPCEPRSETRRLGAYRQADDEAYPPQDWFVPAQLSQVIEVGAGPDARIVLTGWEVWPGSVTLRLGVFLRTVREGGAEHPVHWGGGRGGAGALRCGVLLADGRRVTTLDGRPWPAPAEGPPRPTLQLRAGGGGGFHYDIQLHLSQLPPAGPMHLVVEWPDKGVPETHTQIDATALRDAAADAVAVWPVEEDDSQQEESVAAAATEDSGRGFLIAGTGPFEIMAASATAVPLGPSGRLGHRPEGPPRSDPDRGDWEGMAGERWKDAGLIRSRLAHGADPVGPVGSWTEETPLHLAAQHGSPEAVAELLRHIEDVDIRSPTGRTPLWEAVSHGAREAVELLLAAGADAWSPQLGGRSPGRLALTTELAGVFEALPGAVPLTAQERAAQEDADRRAAVFCGIHTEGLSVAFVAGIDEETAIRRLGADPAAAPPLDLDSEPGPYGTGPDGFDPYDEEAERFVGVTGVPGGCVLLQPSWFTVSTEAVLDALSPGTTAYGLYFNPKGGTFGQFSRDGPGERHEELGSVWGDEPDLHWLYRFWQWEKVEMWDAYRLAYASQMGGLRLTDGRAVAGPPRRWAAIPEGSPLLP